MRDFGFIVYLKKRQFCSTNSSSLIKLASDSVFFSPTSNPWNTKTNLAEELAINRKGPRVGDKSSTERLPTSQHWLSPNQCRPCLPLCADCGRHGALPIMLGNSLHRAEWGRRISAVRWDGEDECEMKGKPNSANVKGRTGRRFLRKK